MQMEGERLFILRGGGLISRAAPKEILKAEGMSIQPFLLGSGSYPASATRIFYSAR